MSRLGIHATNELKVGDAVEQTSPLSSVEFKIYKTKIFKTKKPQGRKQIGTSRQGFIISELFQILSKQLPISQKGALFKVK